MVLIENTIDLIENRYFRIMGIKLGSYLQNYESIDPELQELIQNLQFNIIKCMCEDESVQIRKAALSNLSTNNLVSLKFILSRTRDTDKEIRKLVYDKIRLAKVYLEKLNNQAISYQLLVEGVNNRVESI